MVVPLNEDVMEYYLLGTSPRNRPNHTLGFEMYCAQARIL